MASESGFLGKEGMAFSILSEKWVWLLSHTALGVFFLFLSLACFRLSIMGNVKLVRQFTMLEKH